MGDGETGKAAYRKKKRVQHKAWLKRKKDKVRAEKLAEDIRTGKVDPNAKAPEPEPEEPEEDAEDSSTDEEERRLENMAMPPAEPKAKKVKAAWRPAETEGPSSVSEALRGLGGDSAAPAVSLPTAPQEAEDHDDEESVDPDEDEDMMGSGVDAAAMVRMFTKKNKKAPKEPVMQDAELPSTYSVLFAKGDAEKERIKEEAKAKLSASAAEEAAARIAVQLFGKKNFTKATGLEPPKTLPKPGEEEEDEKKKKAKPKDRTQKQQDSDPKSMNMVQLQERDKRTVFIGNIPLDWSEKTLKIALRETVGDKYTGTYHPIWFRCQPLKEKWAENPTLRMAGRIKQDYAANASDDKIGFVVVDSPEAVDVVRHAAHGLKADSKHVLRVDGIGEQSKMCFFDRKRSVMIGNLSSNTTEACLRKVFEKIDNVSAVRVSRDRVRHECRGFAFVLFENRGSVGPALKLAGEKVKGREIRVSRVEEYNEEGDIVGAHRDRRLRKEKHPAAWRVEQKIRKMRKNASVKVKKRRDHLKKEGLIQDKVKKKGSKKEGRLPKKAGKDTKEQHGKLLKAANDRKKK